MALKVKIDSPLAALGALAGIPVLVLALCFWRALALYWLWKWFAMPMGLVEIPYGHAVGLQLLWTSLSFKSKKDDHAFDWTAFITTPMFLLGTGWLVKTFFL